MYPTIVLYTTSGIFAAMRKKPKFTLCDGFNDPIKIECFAEFHLHEFGSEHQTQAKAEITSYFVFVNFTLLPSFILFEAFFDCGKQCI
jgi:hypothetical protein